MEKIAECQKEQFEANERQEQLASANNRYFVIFRFELDRLFYLKLILLFTALKQKEPLLLPQQTHQPTHPPACVTRTPTPAYVCTLQLQRL